jgi:hypothetical protein
VLRAVFLPGFATPSWAPPPASIITSQLYHLIPPGPEASGLIQPPYKQEIFAGLSEQFTPTVPARAASAGGIKKDLPLSYQAAAGFGKADGALFTTDDGYGCDIRGTQPNKVAVTPRKVAWGEIFSYALRQPLIAEAIGLSYLGVRIPLDASTVADGGWLWLEIDTSNLANWYAQLVNASVAKPYYQQPVRSYAARIPALTGAQSLFAAVLFPVYPIVPTATSVVVDPAQYEADLYATGFTQIVHAYQPVSADAIVGNDNTLVPGTDAGFQIGWDDEQVTAWLNRQVQAAQAMFAQNPADEFPLGVQGYRVDAREVSDGTADPASPTPAWNSLVTVSATVAAGDSFTATGTEELAIEPTPVGNGASPTNFWLPRYFAHWRGRSLIVADKYGYAFGTGGPPAAYPQNPGAPQFSGSLSEILSIGLRYGQWYQFRARLSDLTGGGPAIGDSDPGAGVATIQFLRHVPPKAVGVTLDVPSAPATILVSRPRLNYPEMVFSGAADDTDLDNFLAEVQAVSGTPPIPASSYPSVSMPDPDVVTLEIIVEAQAPKHDTGNPASMRDMAAPPEAGDLDGTFRVVYRQQIPFSGASVSLTMNPQAIADIVPWTPPTPPGTTIVVPTGRNLRVRLRGLGSGDPAYWGSTLASTGLSTDLQLRYEAAAETGVIGDATDAAKLPMQLQAFYLREDPAGAQQAVVASGIGSALQSIGPGLAPGLQNALALAFQSDLPTPIENLAQALDLPVNGLTAGLDHPGRFLDHVFIRQGSGRPLDRGHPADDPARLDMDRTGAERSRRDRVPLQRRRQHDRPSAGAGGDRTRESAGSRIGDIDRGARKSRFGRADLLRHRGLNGGTGPVPRGDQHGVEPVRDLHGSAHDAGRSLEQWERPAAADHLAAQADAETGLGGIGREPLCGECELCLHPAAAAGLVAGVRPDARRSQR